MTTTPNKPSNSKDSKTPVAAAKASTDVKPSSEAKTSLKAICAELKLDPRLAREKLRLAVRDAKKYPELAKAHKPRQAWEWQKGSPAEKEARIALVV
jgi:hypothetical protein